jgi:Ca-activated chloride channel family protein
MIKGMEVEAKLESYVIPPNSTNTNHLLIKLKTPPAKPEQRHPLVIGLAIDKSWSMKGEKMDATIEAACALVNWLTRNDYICIVAYSADVQIVQSLTQLKDKMSVIDKIRSIKVATSTNLSGGWLQTLKIVENSNVPNSYKRVILLTDGQATLGIKEPEQFNKIASDHHARGISTTTIGFGADFNEASLRDIAVAGGGNFYFVSNPEEASEIFFREFGEIGSLYGQALELKVKFSPGVRLMEMFNDYPYSVDPDGNVNIQAGDIRADDLRNIVLALEVNSAHPNFKSSELATVQATFYNLLENLKLENITAKSMAIVEDRPGFKPDTEVVIERLIYSSAKAAIKAARHIQEGDMETAKALINTAIERLESHVSLAPEVLNPVLNRLKNTASKIKTNVQLAGKHVMAMGSDIYSRTEIIDTGGVETHDRIFEYRAQGDIDLYKCPDIKTMVQAQMKEGYKFVIFDLTESKFIDSSGIGAFIQIASWLRRRGGEFVVANTTDTVKKVFEVTRLENHIRIAKSMEEARNIIESIIQSIKS